MIIRDLIIALSSAVKELFLKALLREGKNRSELPIFAIDSFLISISVVASDYEYDLSFIFNYG